MTASLPATSLVPMLDMMCETALANWARDGALSPALMFLDGPPEAMSTRLVVTPVISTEGGGMPGAMLRLAAVLSPLLDARWLGMVSEAWLAPPNTTSLRAGELSDRADAGESFDTSIIVHLFDLDDLAASRGRRYHVEANMSMEPVSGPGTDSGHGIATVVARLAHAKRIVGEGRPPGNPGPMALNLAFQMVAGDMTSAALVPYTEWDDDWGLPLLEAD